MWSIKEHEFYRVNVHISGMIVTYRFEFVVQTNNR